MQILVLGGTSFVGRAIVDAALAGGHDVSLFSRGKTGADLFPDLERLIGDRNTGDYAALAGRSFDAVADVTAYIPRHIAQATDALGDRVGRYLFISTVSVYDIDTHTGDGQPPRLAPERGTEQVSGPTYGPLKVACEDDLLARYDGQATIVRPGIVAGPHDPTDRFTWWVRRAARGGQVALPGRPDQPVQVVDSRDLGSLVEALIAADRRGTYDAVGPAVPATLASLLAAGAAAAETSVEIVPVDPAQVEPALPLVIPPDADALFRISPRAAHEAGMPATSLQQTAADTLAWDRERGEPELAHGLSPEREAELIAAAQR